MQKEIKILVLISASPMSPASLSGGIYSKSLTDSQHLIMILTKTFFSRWIFIFNPIVFPLFAFPSSSEVWIKFEKQSEGGSGSELVKAITGFDYRK